MFSEDWRFITGLGWLQVKIDDIDGSQYIGHVGIEYLAGNRWSFGAAVNLSAIDVDWNAIKVDDGDAGTIELLNAAIKMEINDISVFVRVRF